jgi:Alpha/beta hydrolase domain
MKSVVSPSQSLRIVLLMTSLSAVVCAQAVSVPKSTGPIPVAADSVPFMAAANNLDPTDLAKFGYVEEEFILSGSANVYDWAADGMVTIKTPNVPYANRILLRRPANAARFSGTVIVEVANAARRYDWAMMWGYGRDYFLEHGDAWVGLTAPGDLNSLKKFNPTRYAALSMANPTPADACPGADKNGASAIEEGLRWDYYSQVAAALKSGQPGQPMAGLNVKRVFMTTQVGDITTFINAFHDRSRLANGSPVYDGYLVRNPPAPARINQCAPAIAATDVRRQIKDIDVPVVSVTAQGEVPDSIKARKPDSDDPKGLYRLYEIAGAAHIDAFAYSGLPGFSEQNLVGLAQGTADWPFNLKCDPEIPLSRQPLLMYAFHGAYNNLDEWVAKGVAPPKAPRIETRDGALVMDEFGQAVGGVRNPWVDAPLETTVTTSPGPGTCRELGHTIPFEAARITRLYPSAKDRTSKVNDSVDRAVRAKYFTETDGKKMKADLANDVGK